MTYNVMETQKRVSYYKKKGKQSINTKPSQLYEQYPIPLKKPKADDLHKLVANFVPSEHRSSGNFHGKNDLRFKFSH